MRIRIGTMLIGKVESLDKSAIKTKFFVLGWPIVPLESYYFFVNIQGEQLYLDIPLHGKSVVIAYLRWWLLPISFVSFVAAMGSEQILGWVVGGLAIGLWLLALLCLGRLSTRNDDFRSTMRWNMVGVNWERFNIRFSSTRIGWR